MQLYTRLAIITLSNSAPDGVGIINKGHTEIHFEYVSCFEAGAVDDFSTQQLLF